MTLSQGWRAIQDEAQVAAEQVAAGITVLGRANHAQRGLYLQAFFALSIGLERIGKLIFVSDHAIQNSGSFPTDSDLRSIGHELRMLLPRCEAIGRTVNLKRDYSIRPVDPIHLGIEETLSEFATKLRYYNLNYIVGVAQNQTDPVSMWWEKVARPISARHYNKSKQRKDAVEAAMMGQILGSRTSVLHHAEDGTEIKDISAFFARAGLTSVVQKYGRLYTLQIIRWLASILFELSHLGAYERRIEPLLGLHEPFTMFLNDDLYLKNRKTWSIFERQ
jgi:hypothetical protein